MSPLAGGALSLALATLSAAPAATATARARITFVVTAPAGTPGDATLWIAGNAAELGGWNPSGLRLARAADGTHRATVEVAPGAALEFKVTRGSWETVEKGAGGEELSNRTHAAAGDDTLAIAVARWRDAGGGAPAPRRSTRTGDVREHSAFPSRFVRARDVLVWLPPGYDADTTRRYPVLYFHDGQNVFDDATSFASEWRLDETAARLVAERTVPPFIAVAVANTPDRIADYTPVADARHGGGRLDDYARFLAEELKPFVDATYRTRRGPEASGVVGSSLGGLASLAIAIRRPGTFGLVGAVSPSVWWADRAILAEAARAPSSLRVWLDMGTAEGASPLGGDRNVDDARALEAALRQAGLPAGRVRLEIVEGGRHNEAAWSARLDRVLVYLLDGLR